MKKLQIFFVLAIFLGIGFFVIIQKQEKNIFPQAKVVSQQPTVQLGKKAVFLLKLGKKNPEVARRSLIEQAHAEEDLTIVPHVLYGGKEQKDLSKKITVEKKDAETYALTLPEEDALQAGKYTLETTVITPQGKQTFNYDFSWGVLALNTSKSQYAPGENITVAIAVLNEAGKMDCEAHLRLTITSPMGKQHILSSEEKTIRMNDVCHVYDFTLQPDYQADFVPTEVGEYQLSLRATTKNGTYAINDTVQVKNNANFDVERVTATRIYPPITYPVTLKIVSQEDFSGTVVEEVPAGFAITKPKDGTDPYDAIKKNGETQILTWNVTFQKGKTYLLGYQFKTPSVSPYLYLFQPLRISSAYLASHPLLKGEEGSGKDYFVESRSWQIAADTPSTVGTGDTAGTGFAGQRKVIRTTYGGSGKRTFVIYQDNTGMELFYSDDPEAGSPTWTDVGALSTVGNHTGDMVWDEANSVIYVTYGRSTAASNNNADTFYRRISSISGTPSIGAAQTVLDGTAGANVYSFAVIEIAGDSSTDKVMIASAKGVVGASPTIITLSTASLNSDAPSWTSTDIKTGLTAGAGTGSIGFAQMNSNKLALFYYDGTQYLATRHDDSADADGTSGWDALDGTDASATTISTDDPVGPTAMRGSVIGDTDSDRLWFSWIDSGRDLNTRSWDGSTLNTEYEDFFYGASTYMGGALTSDGANVWIVYNNPDDLTQLLYRNRPIIDTTSRWTDFPAYIIEDAAVTENLTYPSVAKKLYQGMLDVVYTNSISVATRHFSKLSSFTVSGKVYDTDESTFVGNPPCDNSTANIGARTNNEAEVTTTCTNGGGGADFSIAVAASTSASITLYLRSGSTPKANTVIIAGASPTIATANLVKNAVIIRDEDNGSITNAELQSWDDDNDSTGMLFSANSSNYSGESGIEIHVYTGDTYAPGGTVTTSGSGLFHIDDSATATLANATNTLTGGVTIDTSATLNLNATTIITGNIVATGTLANSAGTPTITLRGTGAISGSGTKTVYNLVVGDGTTATTTLSGALTSTTDVSVGTGSTLHQNANLTISGGDFTTTTTGVVDTTSGTGTVAISGSGNVGAGSGGSFSVYNLTVGGTQTLISAIAASNDLTISGSSSLDVSSGNNYAVTVTGAFLNSGTFTAQAGTLTVGGNFTNNSTFTQGTGTVVLNTTTSATVAGSGSPAVTFNNLTIATSDKTVQFTVAETFRVNGLLTITGTSGHNAVITSTTGSQWYINHQGTENVTYATISKSGCDGSSTSITLNGTNTNGGTNGTCWAFPAGTNPIKIQPGVKLLPGTKLYTQ